MASFFGGVEGVVILRLDVVCFQTASLCPHEKQHDLSRLTNKRTGLQPGGSAVFSFGRINIGEDVFFLFNKNILFVYYTYSPSFFHFFFNLQYVLFKDLSWFVLFFSIGCNSRDGRDPKSSLKPQ